MIHHLARAFWARDLAAQAAAVRAGSAHGDHTDTPSGPAREAGPHQSTPSRDSAPRPGVAPVRPRPITPWTTPVNQRAAAADTGVHRSGRPALRISADPSDARRTVISGRFAEVCAALDRLVLEQEALA